MTFDEIINSIPQKPYYRDEQADIVIYNADCRDILPLIPDKSIDLVLTDPPYGTKHYSPDGIWGRGTLTNPSDYGDFTWDEPLDNTVLQLLLSTGKRHIIWGGNYYAHLLPMGTCWLVWDKENGANMTGDCELAWTSLDGAIRQYTFRWVGMLQGDMKNKEYKWHPTQKPISLISWCLSRVPDAQTILDPFLGSGTTAVCAKKLGRQCIGIEIEEKYCEIAKQRLSQSVMAIGG